jgi:hypothetical protein
MVSAKSPGDRANWLSERVDDEGTLRRRGAHLAFQATVANQDRRLSRSKTRPSKTLKCGRKYSIPATLKAARPLRVIDRVLHSLF